MSEKKRKSFDENAWENSRAASATEYTGLMYTPPGDAEQRRSYVDIQPIMGEAARLGDPMIRSDDFKN